VLESVPAGKVPRILVVEDEPTVANLIADVLGDQGMRVDVYWTAARPCSRRTRSYTWSSVT